MNSKKEKSPSSKRIKRFLCLFGESNAKNKCYKSQLDLCTNHLCSCPFYIWSLFGLTSIVLLGSIIHISISLVQFNTINKSYFSKCSTNADCNISKGLQCASHDHVCDCPAGLTKGRCDCNLGTYWSGTECRKKLSFNQTGCVHDYNCEKSLGLFCVNSICQCNKPKYWNYSLGMCDYVLDDCRHHTNWNSITVNIFSSSGSSNYFVETCIERCYNYSFPYAVLYWDGATQRCFCGQLSTATSSTSCNRFCLGEKPRLCGTGTLVSNFDRHRPAYKSH